MNAVSTAPGRILVVDDDQAICLVVSEALRRAGHEVKTAGTIADRASLLGAFRPDILITDVKLPDGDGLDDVQAIIGRWPDMRVIILSAQNTLNTAVRATEQGAFEYLPKPFDEWGGRGEHGRGRQPDHRRHAPGGALCGDAGNLPHHRARADATDLTILILGESGTGKELVARALHAYGKRRNGPFIAVNMAAIPRELIESELFGHEKGAFTGASETRSRQVRAGRRRHAVPRRDRRHAARGADAPAARAAAGEYTTVGGRTPIKVNVRIVAATNKDLQAAQIAAGPLPRGSLLPPQRRADPSFRPCARGGMTSCCWRARSCGRRRGCRARHSSPRVLLSLYSCGAVAEAGMPCAKTRCARTSTSEIAASSALCSLQLATARTTCWRASCRTDQGGEPADFYVGAELFAVSVMLGTAAMTYMSLSRQDNSSALLSPPVVALLLIANLVPAIALLVLLGRRVAMRRAARSAIGGDGQLHVRLVAIFSLIAAIPMLMVVLFASLLFQYGVQFWFSDSARAMLQNAGNFARGYYEQNLREVGDETLTMASDVRDYLNQSKISSPDFAEGYIYQVVTRKMNRSADHRDRPGRHRPHRCHGGS
jgi:CheY-like chemotaxis protein